MRAVLLLLLLPLVGALRPPNAASHTLARRTGVMVGIFGRKKVEEPPPPPPKKGLAALFDTSPRAPPTPAEKGGRDWRFRKLDKVKVQNAGREDWMDVSEQMDAGFLPDWAKDMAADKSFGGPQRQLESVVGVQLVFAFLVLLPSVVGVMMYQK